VLDRAAGEALLHRLDELAAELARFREEVAASMQAANGAGSEGADDPAPRGWRPR
jgi:anti-sigma factor RsiW